MTQDANVRLTGKQIEMLADGLLAAFTGFDDLAQVVLVALDEPMHEIVVQQANFKDQVWQLVQWTDARGKAHNLFRAAVQKVPRAASISRHSVRGRRLGCQRDAGALRAAATLCERGGAGGGPGLLRSVGLRRGVAAAGLDALADEDARAAVVFDLSWNHLSDKAKEAFTVLAFPPGDDVGTNLLQAWLGQAAGGRPHRAARLLAEVANASLLTPVPRRQGRYRYHDRVREYALSKLSLPQDEVRRRLLACWADWDMVHAEFAAIRAHELASQYLRLRTWGVDETTEFAPWFHFACGQASVLGQQPELFFQQAYNQPVESPVSHAARARTGTPEEPVRWLEWVNRAQAWNPPVCQMLLQGHEREVTSVAVTADGQTAVSGSKDKTVRVWDLVGGRCTAILNGHTAWIMSVAVTPDGRTAVSGAQDNTVRVWDQGAVAPPS